MKYRKLRIAWSVFWGVACVLLIALWVRSYSIGDAVCWLDNSLHRIVVGSNSGCIYLDRINDSPNGSPGNGWNYFRFTPGGFTGFRWTSPSGNLGIEIPFWFVVTVASSAAILPSFPRRFSLRTLLITTTFLA